MFEDIPEHVFVARAVCRQAIQIKFQSVIVQGVEIDPADNLIHATRLPISVKRTDIDEGFLLGMRAVEPALNVAMPTWLDDDWHLPRCLENLRTLLLSRPDFAGVS